MSFRRKAIAAAALSLAALAPASFASAADMPVKAVKPIVDVPFFFVIDNRVTFSYIFTAAQPGMFTVNPDGSINAKTTKQVYSFTHFDAWQYGTNFFTISLFKSDHNDPAAPCINAGISSTFAPANCAGASEIYGLFRSTFGFNQIFNTKAFSIGPLKTSRLKSAWMPIPRTGSLALPSATSLPVCSSLSLFPTRATSTSRPWCIGSSPTTTPLPSATAASPARLPGVSCLADGNTPYKPTWAVETNYYMDLGFLPPDISFLDQRPRRPGMARRVRTRNRFRPVRCTALSRPRSSSTRSRSV